jgi:major membrane immunogen (membrane-anchored lipoprotein)
MDGKEIEMIKVIASSLLLGLLLTGCSSDTSSTTSKEQQYNKIYHIDKNHKFVSISSGLEWVIVTRKNSKITDSTYREEYKVEIRSNTEDYLILIVEDSK